MKIRSKIAEAKRKGSKSLSKQINLRLQHSLLLKGVSINDDWEKFDDKGNFMLGTFDGFFEVRESGNRIQVKCPGKCRKKWRTILDDKAKGNNFQWNKFTFHYVKCVSIILYLF